MENVPEELQGMPLLLQRITLRIGLADQGDILNLEFVFLTYGGRCHQLAANGNGGTGGDLRCHCCVAGQIRIDYQLQIFDGASVRELDKSDTL